MNVHPVRFKNLTPMLCVRELGDSIDFYESLGFNVALREEHIALMVAGALRLYLFTASPATDDKPGTHLVPQASRSTGNVIVVLGVNDCRASHEMLVAKGVPFLTEPKQPPWGGWRCFAQDPDRYLIELEET